MFNLDNLLNTSSVVSFVQLMTHHPDLAKKYLEAWTHYWAKKTEVEYFQLSQ